MIEKPTEISAIIPAAGLSSRMHKYKPLLKLGNSTVVEHTISSLKKSRIRNIIDENIQSHLELTAHTALTITRAINKKQNHAKPDKAGEQAHNHLLDMALISAGSLLHDIKRKEPDHAQKEAEYILSLGFPKVADIISQHMGLCLPLPKRLTEAQIVYFADKLCSGDRLEPDLDYSRRFQEKIIQAPHAKDNILKRYEHTRRIQARIEKIVSKPLKSILSRQI